MTTVERVGAMQRGVVVAFDESSGLGVVAGDSGREWPFHCVEIADGSRAIAVGLRVEFLIGFRVLRREATRVSTSGH